MGRFRIAATEYCYKEIDSKLNEQFIHGLNDTDLMVEIFQEFTKVKKINMLWVIKYFYGKGEKRPKEHKQQFWTISK